MYGTIYCITNESNGKKYVGQTIQPLDRRWKEHLNHVKYYDFPLYRAIRKHGKNCFSISVLDNADTREELDAKETHWINRLQTVCPNGYNAINGPPGKFDKVSDETKKKLSDGLRERWKNLEYRQKMKTSTTGLKRKKCSEEHREKLSIAHKGIPLHESQKRKIGEASKRLWDDPNYAERAIVGLKKAVKQQERAVVNIDTGRSYCSATAAARDNVICQQNITKCCQGERQRAGGFRWAYAGEING